MTLPKFAAAEGLRLSAERKSPGTAGEWTAQREAMRTSLVEDVLGGFPEVRADSRTNQPASGDRGRLIGFEPEPGLRLTARLDPAKEKGAPLAVVLDLDGAEKALKGPLAAEVVRQGWSLVTVDLRATGKLAWPSDKVGRAVDHNTAEWGMFIGRPLLGQWVFDVRRTLDSMIGPLPEDVFVLGEGPAGLVALAAAATDPRISGVAMVGSIASYVSETPYEITRLGVIPPGILRRTGDVGDLAAMVLPRRVIVAGGVSGDGKPLTLEPLQKAFTPASRVARLLDSPQSLRVLETAGPAEVVRALK